MEVRSNNVNFGNVYTKLSGKWWNISKGKEEINIDKLKSDLTYYANSKKMMVISVKAGESKINHFKQQWRTLSNLDGVNVILTNNHFDKFKKTVLKNQKSVFKELCAPLFKFGDPLKLKIQKVKKVSDLFKKVKIN